MLQRVIAVGAALTVAAVLGGCASGSGAAGGGNDSVIRIGAHAPLTGPGSDEATEIIGGMQAYFAYLNKNGGIDGRTIEFLVEDDGGDPQAAQAAVRTLVEDDGVLAMVGSIGNETHKAVVEYLNDKAVPDVFVASASRDWNDPEAFPYTFAFRPDLVIEGKIIAQHSLEARPDDARCLLATSDGTGGDFAEGLGLVLGDGGLAVEEQVDPGATDVTAQIGAFAAAGCRTVFLGGSYDLTAAALRAADGIGYLPNWLVDSAGGNYSTLASELGPEANRMLEGLVSADYLPFQASNDWVKMFTKVWVQSGTSGGYELTASGTFGMSLAYTFTEALVKSGSNPSAAKIVDTLEGGRVQGAGIFPLTLSESNHAAYTGVQLTRISSGKQAYMGQPFITGSGTGAIVEYIGAPVALTAVDGIPTS